MAKRNERKQRADAGLDVPADEPLDPADDTQAAAPSIDSESPQSAIPDLAPPIDALPPSREVEFIDGVPYCPDHHCLMEAVRSGSKFRRYKCRVDSCDRRAVQRRSAVGVPREPMICPACEGVRRNPNDQRAASLKGPSACVVDRDGGNEYQVLMRCPVCRWSQHVPRPELVQRRESAPKADLLDSFG